MKRIIITIYLFKFCCNYFDICCINLNKTLEQEILPLFTNEETSLEKLSQQNKHKLSFIELRFKVLSDWVESPCFSLDIILPLIHLKIGTRDVNVYLSKSTRKNITKIYLPTVRKLKATEQPKAGSSV